MPFPIQPCFPISERHALVDAAMHETQALLSEEGVQQAIGSRALQLTALARDYFVPNIRRGIVHIPKEYQHTDSLAILPIMDEERLYLGADFNQTTPQKRQQIRQVLGQNAPDKTGAFINALEALDADYFPLALGREQTDQRAAFVVRAQGSTIIGKSAPTRVMRPTREVLCLLPMQYGKNEVPTVLHELTHVAQHHEEVPLSNNGTVRNVASIELEAHSIGGVVERYCGVNGSQSVIESLRAQHADPSDPYTPTLPLLRAIHREFGTRGLARFNYKATAAENRTYTYESL